MPALMRRFSCGWLLVMIAGCSPAHPPPPEEPVVVANEPAPAANEPAPAANEPPRNGSSAPREGAMCGGIAAIRCVQGQYCAYVPQARCGAGDMSGTCQRLPERCTLELAEICGCDGKTYPNACAAAREGVSAASAGPCSAPVTQTPQPPAPAIAEGRLCGTRGVNGACGEGLYCAYQSACGATDTGGTCQKKAQICTKIYKPVCGCDGKTYGSACTASSAGQSVAKEGECNP